MFESITLFLDFSGTCVNPDCKLISHDEKKNIFEKFWELGGFDAQNYNLAQYVTITAKKTQKLNLSSSKSRPKSNSRTNCVNNKKSLQTSIFTYIWNNLRSVG